MRDSLSHLDDLLETQSSDFSRRDDHVLSASPASADKAS